MPSALIKAILLFISVIPCIVVNQCLHGPASGVYGNRLYAHTIRRMDDLRRIDLNLLLALHALLTENTTRAALRLHKASRP
jgi:hypothetical protein